MDESVKKSIKKKLFFSTLCLVLLLVMMLSTTVAWFTDTQHTTNVMVAGRISITQTTAAWSNLVMMPSQTYDTSVTVTNTGNQPAYVRTIFAFEDTADGSVLQQLQLNTPEGVTIVIPTGTEKIQFTVKGVTYTVGYYDHDLLASEEGKNAYTCLNSVTLSSEATMDWQAAVGDTYEMHVITQAVQQTGFENAAAAFGDTFGAIDAENAAKWFSFLNSTT